MKILRRHRGFTTNSSSASEWVLPTKPPEVQRMEQQQAGQAVQTSDPAPSDSSVTQTSPPQSGSVTPVSTAPEPEPPPSLVVDNLIVIGGLLLTILGVFAIERLVRRVLRKARSDDE